MSRDYIQRVPNLPPVGSLDELLAINLRFAKQYLRKEGALSMMFLGFTPESEVVALVPPIQSDEDKDKAVALVRSLFAQHGVDRYCVMSEAWLSRKYVDVPPSQAPDREEVLLVTVGDREHDLVALCRMRRDPAGRLLRIEAPEHMDGRDRRSAGRFTRLLEAEGPTGAEVAKAARRLAQRYGVGARRYMH